MAFKARFSRGFSSHCQTLRLGSLTWDSELSLLWESFYGIIIFQFVGQHVWDLIFLHLCPSYHLIVASSLSLDFNKQNTYMHMEVRDLKRQRAQRLYSRDFTFKLWSWHKVASSVGSAYQHLLFTDLRVVEGFCVPYLMPGIVTNLEIAKFQPINQ